MSRYLLLAVAALLPACATTAPATKTEATAAAPASAAAAPQSEAAPVDLAALMARESQPMAKKPLSLADGALRGEIETSGEPKAEMDQNVITLSAPIGTESDLTCFFYPESIDAGASLYGVLKSVQQNLNVQSVRPTDVVSIDENPAIFVELDYLVQAEQGPLAGRLKGMVYAHPIHPMMCLHDEVGYSETFKRITLALAASLKTANDQVPVRFAELQITRINGQPVGFERMRVLEGNEGMLVTESVGARLIPRSPTELAVEDTAKSEVSDADGRIVAIAYGEVQNGELSVSMQAKRESGNEYSYQGSHSGKEVSGTFKSKDPAGLASESLIARMVRDELLGGKKAELAIEEYSPGSSPTAPVEALLRRSDKGARAVTFKVGEMVMDGQIDAAGLAEQIQMQIGRLTIESKRAFTRGAL